MLGHRGKGLQLGPVYLAHLAIWRIWLSGAWGVFGPEKGGGGYSKMET
jgi:hypothetical protein